jgi:hypothetical protein
MAYRHNQYNQQQNQQKTQGPQRPRECKVCIDAGKSEAEYKSHWVKDRSGNVTCPTLLNQKCLICGTCGHTSSYCKVQIKSGAGTAPPVKTKPTNPIATKPIATKPIARPMVSNKYALLAIIEQDEERSREQHTASFPPLEKKPEITRPTTAIATATDTDRATPTSLSTWASRINSPPPQPRQLPRRPTRPMAIAVSWADQ